MSVPESRGPITACVMIDYSHEPCFAISFEHDTPKVATGRKSKRPNRMPSSNNAPHSFRHGLRSIAELF